MKILMATLLTLGTLFTAGCAPATEAAPTISLEQAEDANNPACADVGVRLPDKVANFAKRETNAQSTAAWGNPSAVIYRCGLPEVKASDLVCVTSSDIDWLIDDSKRPAYRFITFGRSPAVEVIVDTKQISGVTAVDQLATAIAKIPATNHCK